jgi:hypothetical protein
MGLTMERDVAVFLSGDTKENPLPCSFELLQEFSSFSEIPFHFWLSAEGGSQCLEATSISQLIVPLLLL